MNAHTPMDFQEEYDQFWLWMAQAASQDHDWATAFAHPILAPTPPGVFGSALDDARKARLERYGWQVVGEEA